MTPLHEMKTKCASDRTNISWKDMASVLCHKVEYEGETPDRERRDATLLSLLRPGDVARGHVAAKKKGIEAGP